MGGRLCSFQSTVSGARGSAFCRWKQADTRPGVPDQACRQPAPNPVPSPFLAESVDAHQRSFDVGIHIGYQRRNKDVLAWVKKRRRTIRREDLISFLCGKAPPPRNSRAPPRLTVVSPNRATSAETSSSVEADLQPFREAIALHGNAPALLWGRDRDGGLVRAFMWSLLPL